MKYFTIYLPVEGECKRGELGWSINKCICLYDEGLPEGYCKPIKLFLCSRDIQVGDKIKCIKASSGKGDFGMSGMTYNTSYLTVGQTYEVWMNDRSYWGVHSDDGAMNFPKEYFENYKVIGSISPEAKWVKEGDEFEEEEIRRDVLTKWYAGEDDYTEYCYHHPKGNDSYTIPSDEEFICEYPIKIKCRLCETFH